MTSPTPEVTLGRVRLDYVTVFHYTPDFVVLYVACASKRPIVDVAVDADILEVTLGAVTSSMARMLERSPTRDVDTSRANDTEIRLALPPTDSDRAEWVVTVDGAQYDYTVIAWRPPESADEEVHLVMAEHSDA